MKPISLLALALVILFVISPQSIAQSSGRRMQSPNSRNRNIASIVREIDAKNIERTIRQLVAFGTRNTLSEQNDPKRGIGAARDWLYAEFLKAAETSGGRMESATPGVKSTNDGWLNRYLQTKPDTDKSLFRAVS